MNLANKITFLRIILTPFFFIFFMLPVWTGNYHLVSIIFVIVLFLIAESTDSLDGYVARKYDQVSDFGKILDPFSDVLSRLTYFYCFTLTGIMPSWMFLIIFYREISMMFVRMVEMKKGVVIAANIWGKIKAIFYFLASLFGIMVFTQNYRVSCVGSCPMIYWTKIISYALFGLAVFSSVVSFIIYLVSVFKKKEAK